MTDRDTVLCPPPAEAPNEIRIMVHNGNPLCVVGDDFDVFGVETVVYRRVRGAALKRGNSVQEVGTPQEFLDAVIARFGGIHLDLAATETNTVAGLFNNPETDSLKQPWANIPGVSDANLWLNPPFDPITPWVAKCTKERALLTGDTRILLLCPFAAGTKWWRDNVAPYADVYSVGRMKFVGHVDVFPKDLALCVYGVGTGGKPVEYWQWQPKRQRGVKLAAE